MYYPRAFSKDSLDIIHDRVKRKHRIEIDEDDAVKFAANAIVLDHDIILSGCTKYLETTLEHKDYTVHKTPLTAFHLAGGSAACLTLRLPEPPPRE